MTRALLVFTALLPVAAHAQAPSDDPLPADAPDPFAAPPDPDTEPEAPPPEPSFDPEAVDLVGPAPGFELHGRINLTAGYTDGEDPVELLKYGSLELSSLDLYAQWFPLAYLGGIAELELANELEDDDREWEVELELGVLEVRPLGDDRLRLRVGHMPVPFGLERRHYAPPRNALPTRPAAFRRLFPGTYSDTGAFLWWRDAVGPWGGGLELELGLTFGLQGPQRSDEPNFGDKDNNREPQVSGRLGWTLLELDPDAKGGPTATELPFALRVAVGASLLGGHYDDDAKRRFLFQGYDVQLELGGLRLRGELVFAEFEPADGIGPRQRGFGYYGQVAYHHRFERTGLDEAFVVFRYGRLDPDQRRREPLDVERYHVGLGWIPYEGFLVKCSYEVVTGRDDPPDTVFFEVGYSF